jgi:large subunit ribosomal protein L24
MNRAKTHVKKGDNVVVISGNHTGATGKILQVLTGKNQVLIEGVRLIKKHQRKSQDRPQGEIVQREGPIHISNVKLAEVSEKKEKKAKTTKPKAEKPAKKAA